MMSKQTRQCLKYKRYLCIFVGVLAAFSSKCAWGWGVRPPSAVSSKSKTPSVFAWGTSFGQFASSSSAWGSLVWGTPRRGEPALPPLRMCLGVLAWGTPFGLFASSSSKLLLLKIQRVNQAIMGPWAPWAQWGL